MKKILVLLAPGFEEIEFSAPVDILRRLGFEVTTAAVVEQRVEGAHGIVMEADCLLAELDTSPYEALVLPGGQASWLLRDTAEVIELIKQKNEQGKLIAAICAAPIALEAAGVLEGKTITCYPAEAVTSDIKTVEEIRTDVVVQSGNILTGRGPGAALEFGFGIAKALGLSHEIEAMRSEMTCFN